ncbi:glycerol-3-phosphate cytidylyltransferase [Ancylomarina subtilis]|uniref:Glycerol-3-phosphate cytidylyltransferase n=1 Tax=Ancylomarina subtilis TaxID=1639035 RepID=A0A4Q7VHJ2_9BACT|nr:adenylyltransferase/cytidyltransferase family protein [Ancylomarina subtilis]RZT95566.1 glycerol-3-phosphate cytidylyltransferase [Ancylomarina subtilis]
MLKDTLKKFGYPRTLIKEYKHWLLLVREQQLTLGSMILICREEKHNFHEISSEATSELSTVTKDIELSTQKIFKYDKINYNMLMMVDPEVHFHVIPRYSKNSSFKSNDFVDIDWPKPVNFTQNHNTISQEQLEEIKIAIQDNLPNSNSEKKYGKMYTSGCYDLLHFGHLNIFKQSKELCDHLIVGVSTDELILKTKGKKPVIPFEERARMVSSIKYVDEVIPQEDKDKQKVVDKYGIDAISVGDDWKGKYPPVTCEMVYFSYTKSVSSTILKNTLKLIDNK